MRLLRQPAKASPLQPISFSRGKRNKKPSVRLCLPNSCFLLLFRLKKQWGCRGQSPLLAYRNRRNTHTLRSNVPKSTQRNPPHSFAADLFLTKECTSCGRRGEFGCCGSRQKCRPCNPFLFPGEKETKSHVSD